MNTLLQIIVKSYQTYQQPQDKSTFLGISGDGWFTGLVPVFIFIVGYIINKAIENRKERQRLNELEEYFKQSVRLLQKPLTRQIDEFLNISHLLKEKKEQHLVLKDITNFHVEQIKEISNKDLYSIYIKNREASILEKTELYSKLRAGIDFIDNVRKTMREKFMMFWESYNKNQNEFKRNIEITDEIFNDLIARSPSPSIQADWLVSGIDKIRLNWISVKDKGIDYMDMYVAKELYLEPLRELCKQDMRDPRTAALLKYTMAAIYSFHNIDVAKAFFRQQYVLDARGLRKSQIEINKAIAKFDTIRRVYR